MRAKKSLGQHFLKSKSALHAMVIAGHVTKTDTVLEIGPGTGALTRALLETGAHVIAVETDSDLIPVLEQTFSEPIALGKLQIIHGDIRILHSNILKNIRMVTPTYKVVANIPYYITGEIIRMFLETELQPTSMTLLVQKEVCDRIVSRDGKGSVLSVSVQAYGTPKYIQKVPARDFNPPPKVDSAILHIHNITKNFFSAISEEDFFTTVKTGFSSKRKKLANNLKTLWDAYTVQQALTKAGVTADTRPERTTLTQWRTLTQALPHNTTSR